jgi:predicted metal-dependent phosphotriesterase family hydrolase
LRRLAQATGLHLIMGSGWYRERLYPGYIQELSTNHLADLLVQEFSAGVDGTGVRPGIIGEIGTERFHITPAEERVFRACARAQREIGATITTHTTHLGERRDAADVIAIAEKGVYVELDHVGQPASVGWQPEVQRARNVVEIVRAGYLEQVLLSMDTCTKSQLHWFGGQGYDCLLRSFVPLLARESLSQDEIRTILVDNPRRALAF